LRGSSLSGRMGSCYLPLAGLKMFTDDIHCSFWRSQVVASRDVNKCLRTGGMFRVIPSPLFWIQDCRHRAVNLSNYDTLYTNTDYE
jgi:hypothetical protein